MAEGQASGGTRVAPAGGVGEVQCRPTARGRARRRFIRLTTDDGITASLLAGGVSYSVAGRREFNSHANARSATQRLGRTANPVMPSVRCSRRRPDEGGVPLRGSSDGDAPTVVPLA
ncbi:hypothetical protein GCM10010302_32160 [Streptomyces polychromogenes]|uniref:Uncharacterized protein n=1 Tax=Streptomyces polychromogenes TaxID=67342 RepID=A0ABP3F3Y0_9ACTN